jgi:hypothetical protein
MDQYGGEKKSKKSKKSKKTKKTTKTTKSTKDSTKSKTKKSTKTTKTRSKAKGGNFLGTIGDLVAPTGWGPFATATGLLALDRADAALRRGTKEKKEKMKGGKMKGGSCDTMSNTKLHEKMVHIERPGINQNRNILKNLYALNGNIVNNPKYLLGDSSFFGHIDCKEGHFEVSIEIFCGENNKSIKYTPNEKFNNFQSLNEAREWLSNRKNQLALINLALLKNHDTCKNPDYKSAYNLRQLSS